MNARAILARLQKLAQPGNLEGMARYGIQTDRALGVPVPALRALAKEVGRDHGLALRLWDTGIHEARILASFIDDPQRVTSRQADRWTREFDSWDVCDLCCNNLFCEAPFAYKKAVAWSGRKNTFVKRAGFALMCSLAVHDKTRADADFVALLKIVEREAMDDRNYVKKAVNWALRQIGKRNPALHQTAIRTARRIARMDSKSARWIASDALRELENPRTRARIKVRGETKT